jgi:hypothetical protein
MLESHNINYLINPLNKKLTEDELLKLVSDFDVIIAGTEQNYTNICFIYIPNTSSHDNYWFYKV